ncbi:hypothetical protein [Thermococcus radiotolerans]|uniref:Sulfatase N-terminal domain-containing protein n=1 Tax=Thermococcus radiotolerans TaxID=187880 RepID=A0A2Z2N1J9_9EURY|nr:hypothetical protein [Thermococcus radiotolerans]ASJ15374.1 hypothetical protein A3L10_09620 [Thermococcus radiotolerans]
MRYTNKLATIKRYYKDFNWWKNTFIWYISPLVYRKNEGFSVTSEYWDYLIILDACRFDIFKEEIKKTGLYNQGTLEYRISSGSMTAEFLLENFEKGEFKDIVYITANPFVDMLLKGKFYRIIPVWKDGWDSKLNTVHPKTVYQYTLRALEKYPEKRFIIHFMQPHFPYLTFRPPGDTGFSKHREAALAGQSQWRDKTIWDLVMDGTVPLGKVKEAYRDNLRIALKYVELLVPHLAGRIIITSDHGEAFGEKLHPLIPLKIYGHPRHVRIPALIKVPWFVISKPPKRKWSSTEEMKLKRTISALRLKGKI